MSADQKIEGLPVPGYRAQTPEAVAAVTVMRLLEEELLQLFDTLATDPVLDADKRWLAIGRTGIEQGFMAISRSIFKPSRAQLPGPSLVEQWSE